MAEGSKAWHYIFIVIFSALIVAIGASDLHRRFLTQPSPLFKDGKKLVEELRGDEDIARASPKRSLFGGTDKETDSLNGSDRKELGDLLDKVAP